MRLSINFDVLLMQIIHPSLLQPLYFTNYMSHGWFNYGNSIVPATITNYMSYGWFKYGNSIAPATITIWAMDGSSIKIV